ncbi:unnamed protein product [Lactuca virosa]|uniref:Vacuolar iron transporter n=2 Tax=Lactuca virosa TaxID=75947 RepID=A0AAU9PKZ3_9ASTR|nr:unnamed protein product [Lactuca virosa]
MMSVFKNLKTNLIQNNAKCLQRKASITHKGDSGFVQLSWEPMIGVGAVKKDVKSMILSGFAMLVAGACSMAIGEFVSVYSQLDVEVAQIKRSQQEKEKDQLPNPIQAAVASALAFSLGAIVPLLAASFIGDHKVRMGVVVAAVSMALVVFGWAGSLLGGTPVVKSCFRVLFGGLMAMAITFGLTKLIGSTAI